MAHEVNDVVYALGDISDPPSGDSPGGRLCRFGDKLIIRAVRPEREFKYLVSHEDVTDGSSFAVTPKEVSKMRHFNHNYDRYMWENRFR